MLDGTIEPKTTRRLRCSLQHLFGDDLDLAQHGGDVSTLRREIELVKETKRNSSYML